VPIENLIKAELSVVSQAILIGDRRKFLSVLLTLKVKFVFTMLNLLTVIFVQTDTDMETGEPLDKLSNGAKAWCQEQGSSAATVSEIINSPDEKVVKL
jgi:long-chain-fatty-acid--CoA ligase ACSBG